MRAKNRGGGLHDHLGKGRGPTGRDPRTGRGKAKTNNHKYRDLQIESGRRRGTRRGETQDRNHERTWEGEEPELMPKLPGTEMSEEVQISTQRVGQDLGTINDPGTRVRREDSGHGRAWRVSEL